MPLKRLVPPASEPVPVARGMLVRDTVPTGYKVMRSGAPHACERAQLGQIHDRSTTRLHHERASGDDVTLDFNAHIRGCSSASTPPRPRAASSSASTRWGRNQLAVTQARAG